MQYPGSGSYGMGGDDPNSLESRKKALIQRLVAAGGRNQTGLTGLHAMPIFGGRGRGSFEAPQAARPALDFNPFLAMASGRNEQFQAPDGLTQEALMQAQAGLAGQNGGPSPMQGGNPAAAFLGTQGSAGAGLDGPGAAQPSQPSPAGGAPQDLSWMFPSASPRHLTGGGAQGGQQVDNWWVPRVGSNIAR